MLVNPLHFGFITKDIPYVRSWPLWFKHFMNQLWHLAPVYLFRNRLNIISNTTVFLTFLLFSTYLILMPEWVLLRNYELDRIKMMVMAGVFAAFCLLFKKIEGWTHMHVIQASIFLFLAAMFLVHWTKPRAVYNEDGSLREFGVGSTKKTVTPLWFVAILAAIACYSIAYLKLDWRVFYIVFFFFFFP